MRCACDWVSAACVWVSAVTCQAEPPGLVEAAPPVVLQMFAPRVAFAVGAPIVFEVVIVGRRRWSRSLDHRILDYELERRMEDSKWCAIPRASEDICGPFGELWQEAGTMALPMPLSAEDLARVATPGRWRTRACVAGKFHSEWIEWESVEHPGNRRMLEGDGTRGGGRLAWYQAVCATALRAPFDERPGRSAAAAEADRVWVGELEEALRGMRAAGVCPTLAQRAECCILARDVDRIASRWPGAERDAATAALQREIDRLLAETEPVSSPLAGMHGEVLSLHYELLGVVAPEQAERLQARTKLRWPLLRLRSRY